MSDPSDEYTIHVNHTNTNHYPVYSDHFNDVVRSSGGDAPYGLQRTVEMRSYDKFGNVVGNTREDGSDLEPVSGTTTTFTILSGSAYIKGVRCDLVENVPITIGPNGYYTYYAELPPEYEDSSDYEPPYTLDSNNISYYYDPSSYPDIVDVNKLPIAKVDVGSTFSGTMNELIDIRQMYCKGHGTDQVVQIRQLNITESATFNGVNITDYTVPVGMIGIFDASCPSGWTHVSAYNGKFIRGAASAGATGGSDTIAAHHHTIPSMSYTGNTGSGIGTFSLVLLGVPSVVLLDHTHSMNHTHSAQTSSDDGGHDNRPSYIEVVFCKKD
ncbi:MAG: hypothetical protein ACTSRA_00425 [Promethearchaeota archaeon]